MCFETYFDTLNGDLTTLMKQSEKYKQLYLIQSIKTATSAQSVWDDSTLNIENVRQFKKVRVNNKLRGSCGGNSLDWTEQQ